MSTNDTYNQLISYLRTEIRGLRKGSRLPSFRTLMTKLRHTLPGYLTPRLVKEQEGEPAKTLID